MTIVLALAMGTGCSTVKSGLSALGGGKPHQVTVVNNIEPAPPVVIVQPAAAPVVAAPIVAAEPAMIEPEELPRPRKSSRFGRLKAVASGAFAGALVGTAVGYALDGSDGAAKGAALGAGAGAVGGAAAHRTK